MTYIFNDIEQFTDENYFQAIKFVPKERAEKSMRYKFMTDKKISLIAYLLLVYGMKKEFDICKPPEILTEKLGKPYLKDSNISFNLSHTRKGVMCSISENRVGCDIEKIVEKTIAVRSIFCKNEIEIIENAPKCFTKIWTLKEAYSKCMGFGLTQKLSGIDFSKYVCADTFDMMGKRFWSGNKEDLYYSVCIDSIQEDVQQIFFLKIEELFTMRFKFEKTSDSP